jgi:hypothetical protein
MWEGERERVGERESRNVNPHYLSTCVKCCEWLAVCGRMCFTIRMRW